jgi:hypothetical protein
LIGDLDDFFPSTPRKGVDEEFKVEIKFTRHAIDTETKRP